MSNRCVIKIPKFHNKQQIVWDSQATEILFGGDTRSGKSFFIRRAYIIWCSSIPGLITDIFRVNYEDVINNYMTGETSFPVLLREWERSGLCIINEAEIKFWNDSIISLNHCANDKVTEKHQGNACHVRTLEESARMLERRVRSLTGWVTMSEAMKARVPEKWKGLFPKIFHITNPLGPAAGYYTRHFVDKRPAYAIEQVGAFRRQYIPAELGDNPSEDVQSVIARIKEAFPDEATQKALLKHDWHARTGNFFTEWDEDRHVVTDFTPPAHWRRFRTYDWGTAAPAAVYWWAISDGEPFADHEGYERWFPRGALVAYEEWYICDDGHADPDLDKPAEGRRMRNEDMAKGIVERSEYEHQNLVTLTDSKPFQDTGGDGPAAVFKKHGVPLEKGDTSRVAGWSQMRGRLIGFQMDTNARDAQGNPVKIPMIFFCERCKYARDYIPALPRHPSESNKEDAAEHGEATHSCDAIRLACMALVDANVKDKTEPMQSRIEKELKARRPTLKNIMGGKIRPLTR